MAAIPGKGVSSIAIRAIPARLRCKYDSDHTELVDTSYRVATADEVRMPSAVALGNGVGNAREPPVKLSRFECAGRTLKDDLRTFDSIGERLAVAGPASNLHNLRG